VARSGNGKQLKFAQAEQQDRHASCVAYISEKKKKKECSERVDKKNGSVKGHL
jgi:hypothetical protein